MIDKKYHTISEVTKILGLINKNGSLNTHTLRFWETKFKQIKPIILNNNRRYYDEKNIILLKKIKYLLKNKGLTIKGAIKVLNNEESNDLDEFYNETIKSKIFKISKLIKNLKK